jgi:hypothetical protein
LGCGGSKEQIQVAKISKEIYFAANVSVRVWQQGIHGVRIEEKTYDSPAAEITYQEH